MDRGSMFESGVCFTQENSACIYEMARESARSQGGVRILQANAAETSHHSRWLMGVESSCICDDRARKA
jgi:hypothetical protein